MFARLDVNVSGGSHVLRQVWFRGVVVGGGHWWACRICPQALQKDLRRRVERIGTQEASNLASHDIFSGKTSVDRSSILVNVIFIRFGIY